MTTAERIKATIEGATAVTLAGGYAVFLDKPRALFEPAHIKAERRNDKGRCTYLHATYADGSSLHFRWSAAGYASYRAA